jgi:hypothetical protein
MMRGCWSGFEPQREHQQADVRWDAERSQYAHHVAARPELLSMETVLAHFREELLVACICPSDYLWLINVGLLHTLLSSEQTDEEDTGSVYREQCANRVELGCEDLEHDERKRELANRGANVGSFKRPLRCSNFHHLSRRQNDGPGSM